MPSVVEGNSGEPALSTPAVANGPVTPAVSRWIRRENEQGRKYWQNSVNRDKTFKQPPLAAGSESIPAKTANKSGVSQLVKGTLPSSLVSMFVKRNTTPSEAVKSKQASRESTGAAERPKDNADVV